MPVVATNTAANTAILYLNKNAAAESKSLSKLSSGSNIVSASDDASGLAISTTLQSDITVLNQAATNAQQAQSVLETADGALSNVADILQRMKSLTAQSISGSVDDASRAYIDAEYSQLLDEIDGIVTSTTFNNAPLLDGTYNQDYLVGTDATNDLISVDLSTVDATTTGLGVSTGVDTSANATTASGEVDAAIDLVSSMRSLVGAYESRFSFRADVIDTSITNLESAKSSITDVDIASEQSNYTTQQVLTEVATAALAQANQMKSSLLSLVK
jgi:flagellin